MWKSPWQNILRDSGSGPLRRPCEGLFHPRSTSPSEDPETEEFVFSAKGVFSTFVSTVTYYMIPFCHSRANGNPNPNLIRPTNYKYNTQMDSYFRRNDKLINPLPALRYGVFGCRSGFSRWMANPSASRNASFKASGVVGWA